jgi:hypothetical protein
MMCMTCRRDIKIIQTGPRQFLPETSSLPRCFCSKHAVFDTWTYSTDIRNRW